MQQKLNNMWKHQHFQLIKNKKTLDIVLISKLKVLKTYQKNLYNFVQNYYNFVFNSKWTWRNTKTTVLTSVGSVNSRCNAQSFDLAEEEPLLSFPSFVMMKRRSCRSDEKQSWSENQTTLNALIFRSVLRLGWCVSCTLQTGHVIHKSVTCLKNFITRITHWRQN